MRRQLDAENASGPQHPATTNIRSFRDLEVYEAAMEVFEITEEFPKAESYSTG
jgi:hypothetical protein